MKILITSGATREAIDGIRYISNVSSGRTGARIAEKCLLAGHEVIYLSGQGSAKPEKQLSQPHLSCHEFSDFQDLNQMLQKILHEEDVSAVVHLAAVSDYSIASIELDGKEVNPDRSKKVPSDQNLSIRLKKNFKIVHQLKNYSKGSNLLVIAFKLTQGADADSRTEAVQKLFSKRDSVDWVVQNDWSEITAQSHPFVIHHANGTQHRVEGATELASALIQIISTHRGRRDS